MEGVSTITSDTMSFHSKILNIFGIIASLEFDSVLGSSHPPFYLYV